MSGVYLVNVLQVSVDIELQDAPGTALGLKTNWIRILQSIDGIESVTGEEKEEEKTDPQLWIRKRACYPSGSYFEEALNYPLCDIGKHGGWIHVETKEMPSTMYNHFTLIDMGGGGCHATQKQVKSASVPTIMALL